jgi:hypothetical protein
MPATNDLSHGTALLANIQDYFFLYSSFLRSHVLIKLYGNKILPDAFVWISHLTFIGLVLFVFLFITSLISFYLPLIAGEWNQQEAGGKYLMTSYITGTILEILLRRTSEG